LRGPYLWIRPLDLPQILTGVSGRRFPWTRCGIATRSGGRRVARDQLTGLTRPYLLIRPLDRSQIFKGVSGHRFPWSSCGIATRSGGGRVARDQLTGLKRS
jgi:hypothetical protein